MPFRVFLANGSIKPFHSVTLHFTDLSTGGILYPKQNESVFCTVECSYVGTWIVTLTVTVNGSYADSQPAELVVYPRVDE
ncbi:MAG TPA: hypothetical protein ENI44_03105 [Thermoplasmatales archaeon]|nr:hypothetical protein [Thermoplasmatales archaeon]